LAPIGLDGKVVVPELAVVLDVGLEDQGAVRRELPRRWIKKNQIELLSGQTSTHKKFLIRDIDFNEMMMRISKLLAELESA
jgi:hypothetical protein